MAQSTGTTTSVWPFAPSVTHNPRMEGDDHMADRYLTPAAIADLFGETEPQPRQQIQWIARRFGPLGMAALVEAVLAIEAQGGIVLPTGSRRTHGGVLFWLVKSGWKPPAVPHVPLAEALQT